MGFSEAKQRVLRDLQAGNFVHEVRRNISSRNLLLTGRIGASDLAGILRRARGRTTAARPITGMQASRCTRSSPKAGT